LFLLDKKMILSSLLNPYSIFVSILTTHPFIYKLNRPFFMYKMVFLKKYFLKENNNE